jgi:hypothetical protein
VIDTLEGAALTDEPDPDRLASDRSSGKPIMGRSCLRNAFKASGLLAVGFGGVILVNSVIAIVFFNTPLQVNGRVAGKMEAVLTQLGFLAVFVAFGAVWYFLCDRILLPGPSDTGGLTCGTTIGSCGKAISGWSAAGSPLEESKGWRSIARGGSWRRRLQVSA